MLDSRRMIDSFLLGVRVSYRRPKYSNMDSLVANDINIAPSFGRFNCIGESLNCFVGWQWLTRHRADDAKTWAIQKKKAVPMRANCRDESLVFPLGRRTCCAELGSTRERVTRCSASSGWSSLVSSQGQAPSIFTTSLATR